MSPAYSGLSRREQKGRGKADPKGTLSNARSAYWNRGAQGMRCSSPGVSTLAALGQQGAQHVTMHVREATIESVVVIGELFVVEPKNL
jgi:hypothetical protein